MNLVPPVRCSLSSPMVKCLLLAVSIVYILCAGCGAQEQSPATMADPRFPVPSDEELTRAIETLKSVYAEEYQQAAQGDASRKRLSCATLAKKLLKDAKDSSPTGSGYFAMLKEAISFAALGETVNPSFEAIDLLAVHYQVDEHFLRLQTLASFAETSKRLSTVREAGAFVIPTIRTAANAQKLETAQLQIEIGEKIAKRLLDRSLQKDIARSSEVLTLLQQQADSVSAAHRTLKIDSGDEEANLTLAKFIGLRKGDWEGAEVYAAQVNKDEIRGLFVRELALPTETDELLRLGDDWWEFSETMSGAEKLQAQRVAAGHYVSIFKDLKGFEQKQTELRLEEVTQEEIIPVRIPLMIKTHSPASKELELTGLVQAYSFDKGTATISFKASFVDDTSGKGQRAYLDGPFGGVKIAQGISGQCLEFSGSPNSMFFPDHHLPTGLKPRTISFWMKASPQPTRGVLFTYGTGADNAFTLIIFEPQNPVSQLKNTLTLVQAGNDSPRVNVSSTSQVTDNKWHNIVAVYDGSRVQIFVDGKEEVDEPVYKNTTLTGEAFISNLGHNDRLHSYTGCLDEFMIFDRAMTSEEVRLLYDHIVAKSKE